MFNVNRRWVYHEKMKKEYENIDHGSIEDIHESRRIYILKSVLNEADLINNGYKYLLKHNSEHRIDETLISHPIKLEILNTNGWKDIWQSDTIYTYEKLMEITDNVVFGTKKRNNNDIYINTTRLWLNHHECVKIGKTLMGGAICTAEKVHTFKSTITPVCINTHEKFYDVSVRENVDFFIKKLIEDINVLCFYIYFSKDSTSFRVVLSTEKEESMRITKSWKRIDHTNKWYYEDGTDVYDKNSKRNNQMLSRTRAREIEENSKMKKHKPFASKDLSEERQEMNKILSLCIFEPENDEDFKTYEKEMKNLSEKIKSSPKKEIPRKEVKNYMTDVNDIETYSKVVSMSPYESLRMFYSQTYDDLWLANYLHESMYNAVLFYFEDGAEKLKGIKPHYVDMYPKTFFMYMTDIFYNNGIISEKHIKEDDTESYFNIIIEYEKVRDNIKTVLDVVEYMMLTMHGKTSYIFDLFKDASKEDELCLSKKSKSVSYIETDLDYFKLLSEPKGKQTAHGVAQSLSKEIDNEYYPVDNREKVPDEIKEICKKNTSKEKLIESKKDFMKEISVNTDIISEMKNKVEKTMMMGIPNDKPKTEFYLVRHPEKSVAVIVPGAPDDISKNGKRLATERVFTIENNVVFDRNAMKCKKK